jgi:peptidoglycan/LPS O-acetylase OafA/YrhL
LNVDAKIGALSVFDDGPGASREEDQSGASRQGVVPLRVALILFSALSFVALLWLTDPGTERFVAYAAAMVIALPIGAVYQRRHESDDRRTALPNGVLLALAGAALIFITLDNAILQGAVMGGLGGFLLGAGVFGRHAGKAA